ncbi:hypothetical protein AMAG_05054 [Allomyces macrogynus ATCC 38327]|uniref:HCP-like protein n=1 Tax=Allomyces macrogynus (strain ATCC 38327) TaxID=578462 RepID=A0A0L0S741_ALLM3|nr:hypothetical protein AMAG_05054 [Allomyces macrogynus ATCC 38327]|eukprot:KNE58245.1 hypothetical protein AMAG_05054 [Allomyces macrogynus ATCC 38327]
MYSYPSQDQPPPPRSHGMAAASNGYPLGHPSQPLTSHNAPKRTSSMRSSQGYQGAPQRGASASPAVPQVDPSRIPAGSYAAHALPGGVLPFGYPDQQPYDQQHQQDTHHDDDQDPDEPPLAHPFVNPRQPPSDFNSIVRHISLPRGALTGSPAPNDDDASGDAAGYGTSASSDSASRNLTPEEMAAAEADECIQRGIVLHEQLDLAASTELFKRAADLGSPTGMYLYGMALRSGWGVAVDAPASFVYLSRAADLAMRQAQAAKSNGTGGPGVAARELTLAIYELGQSFRNGWGVKRCRRTGAFYLQIAANLGDPDAQVDVATCYLNGDGVKRDKQAAARFFRLASNQGIELPGNSWIWKAKYDGCGIVRKPSKRHGGASAPSEPGTLRTALNS